MARCKWHRCNREFEPTDPRQRFCSIECRKDRSRWRELRGATIIDVLLDGSAEDIMAARRKLKEEIENDLRNA